MDFQVPTAKLTLKTGSSVYALITFTKGKRVLTAFPYPVNTPQDYVAAIEAAYEQFKKENPKVNLFDNIQVLFERVEKAP